MENDEQLLLEHIQELKENEKRLEEELVEKNKPWMSHDSVKKIISTFWTLFIIGSVIGAVAIAYYLIISSKPVGNFYVERVGNVNYATTEDWDDCYKVYQEHRFGKDNAMSKCIKSKDEAYSIAEDFANKWHSLNSKASK